MKPILIRISELRYALISEKPTKLKPFGLADAFRAALEIEPELDRKFWIDQNYTKQPYPFDGNKKVNGFVVRARDERTNTWYWYTGGGWREEKEAARKFVKETSKDRAIQSAKNRVKKNKQSYFVDFEYVPLYEDEDP